MTISRIRAAAILAGLLLTLAGQTATADKPLTEKGQGMEARLFRNAVDTKGHFSVDATPVLPHLAISLGLVLDFGFKNHVAVEQDGGYYNGHGNVYDKTTIDSYIFSVLMFNLGLMDMIEVGIQIPIVIPSGQAFNGFDHAEDNNPPVAEGWSTKGGVGDLAAHLKLRWIRADRHAIGLGTVIQYQAPIGKPEYLMGEGGGGAISAKMILDIEPISWYRVSFNLGGRYAFNPDSSENYLNKNFWTEFDTIDGASRSDRLLFKYGPMINFGIGQSFVLWPGVMDAVVEVYGNHLLTSMANMGYFSMEANVGFKVYVERNSYLMGGYAHGIPVAGTDSGYGFQSMEHRLFLGFAFEPSMGDRDFDGIKDDVDQCPDEPEDFDDFTDSDGCPEPDNDRDGILDVDDDCPMVPEDMDNDEDQDGCPERGAGDRDGDGILDEVDQCPDDPEDLDQFEDDNGCPDNDNDNDKIPDVEDVCPNEPEDEDGWEDMNGCPDPDNDADRIPDVDDMCPNEPEVYNGHEDTDGCPDEGRVKIIGTDIKILDKVYFEYDSATIKEESYDILDAVAATVNGNPQITLIEVSGHADERGDDDYNQRLTADRAASVVTYLVKKGVKATKLLSAGFGEYCPMDKGHNEAAWEKNRRVEFKIITVDDNPTNVERGCDAAKAKGVNPPPIPKN